MFRTLRKYFLVSCETIYLNDEFKLNPVNYTATITRDEVNKKFNPENNKVRDGYCVAYSMIALKDNFDLTIDNNKVEEAFKQTLKLDSIVYKDVNKNKIRSLFLLPSLFLPGVLGFAFPFIFVFSAITDLVRPLPPVLESYEKNFDKKFGKSDLIIKNVDATYLIAIKGPKEGHAISLKVKDNKYYLYDCNYGLFELDSCEKLERLVFYLIKQYRYYPIVEINKIED